MFYVGHWDDCVHPNEQLRLTGEQPDFHLSIYRCALCGSTIVTRTGDTDLSIMALGPDVKPTRTALAAIADAFHRLDRNRLTKPAD